MSNKDVVNHLIDTGILQKVETNKGPMSVWRGEPVSISLPLPIPDTSTTDPEVPMANVIMELLNLNFSLTSEDIAAINHHFANQMV